MAWTLVMLAIAFGLAVSAFIGWRRECREEEAQASAQEPDGEGTGFRMTRRERSTDARPFYANAKP